MDESNLPPPIPGNGPGLPPGLSAILAKWQALDNAAGVVAGLAGRERVAPAFGWDTFPDRIPHVPAWQQRLIAQGIEDLAVIMEAGISALIAVETRGIDPRPAAASLWAEYEASIASLVHLVPGQDEPTARG
jgi:hypothetical protein